ncbi:MAG: TAXI family TRAP transporter solute-binding subunit [Acidobacteria bacterium]|nr:TAXI family TRAP transporter solute-binding subunit [Acidobacteriota bacterium]
MKRRHGFRWMLAGSFLLWAACARDRTPPQNLTLAVASTGGTFHALGEGIAEVIRREMPGFNVNVTTSQIAANPARVATGEVDLALAHSTNTIMALRGKKPFSRAYPEIRALARVYDGYYHFVVARKTGITGFSKIRELRYPLRISANTVGSFMDYATADILRLHQISLQDLKSWGGEVLHLSSNQSQDLMQDGQLDGFVTAGPIPVRYIQMVQVNQEVNVLPLEPLAIAHLQKEYDVVPGKIPAQTYKGQDQEIPTVLESIYLITSERFPQKSAFQVARALEQHRDHLAKVYAALADATASYLKNTGSIPLHEGAREYYDSVKAP